MLRERWTLWRLYSPVRRGSLRIDRCAAEALRLRREPRGWLRAGPIFSSRLEILIMLFFTLALLAGSVDSAIVRDIEVAPGETIRTTSVGAGQPLVLIPGIFGAAFGYRTITGPLVARGYRCIVVEPLGYGWSGHPKEADYSFTAQTERVGRALDQL